MSVSSETILERLGTESAVTDASTSDMVVPVAPQPVSDRDIVSSAQELVKRIVLEASRVETRVVYLDALQPAPQSFTTHVFDWSEPSGWALLKQTAFEATRKYRLYWYSMDATERRSPFESLDSTNAVAVIDLLSTVRSLPRRDANAILNRLNDLFSMSRKEPEQRVMSARSLGYFLDFLRTHPEIRTPLIFLLDSGFIRAEWQVAPSKALAVSFLAGGDVEYVALAPRYGRPRSVTTLSGDNVSWRGLVPALYQSADVSWLSSDRHPR